MMIFMYHRCPMGLQEWVIRVPNTDRDIQAYILREVTREEYLAWHLEHELDPKSDRLTATTHYYELQID